MDDPTIQVSRATFQPSSAIGTIDGGSAESAVHWRCARRPWPATDSYSTERVPPYD